MISYLARKTELEQVLSHLSTKYREVIIYRFVHQLSVRETASVLLVLPATVYAADRIYQSFIEKNGFQTNVHVQQDVAEAKKIVPVKLKVTYLPEGSEEKYKGSLKYYLPEEEGYDHSVSLNLTKLDVKDWTFSSYFTVDYQEFQAGEHQAYLVNWKKIRFVMELSRYILTAQIMITKIVIIILQPLKREERLLVIWDIWSMKINWMKCIWTGLFPGKLWN